LSQSAIICFSFVTSSPMSRKIVARYFRPMLLRISIARSPAAPRRYSVDALPPPSSAFWLNSSTKFAALCWPWAQCRRRCGGVLQFAHHLPASARCPLRRSRTLCAM
jgi:hypothetical protein